MANSIRFIVEYDKPPDWSQPAPVQPCRMRLCDEKGSYIRFHTIMGAMGHMNELIAGGGQDKYKNFAILCETTTVTVEKVAMGKML